MHPCESEEQIAVACVLVQMGPTAPPAAAQTGTVLHVHSADPAAPVQVWFTLEQATGAPYE
jgi:hypothetical protein